MYRFGLKLWPKLRTVQPYRSSDILLFSPRLYLLLEVWQLDLTSFLPLITLMTEDHYVFDAAAPTRATARLQGRELEPFSFGDVDCPAPYLCGFYLDT